MSKEKLNKIAGCQHVFDAPEGYEVRLITEYDKIIAIASGLNKPCLKREVYPGVQNEWEKVLIIIDT